VRIMNRTFPRPFEAVDSNGSIVDRHCDGIELPTPAFQGPNSRSHTCYKNLPYRREKSPILCPSIQVNARGAQPQSFVSGTVIVRQCTFAGITMGGYVHPPFEIPRSLLDDLTRLGPLLDAATAAQRLGQRIFTDLLVGTAIDTNLKIVTYLIFGKAFKSFQAIHNLCLSGCGSDALAMCGTLFENYVDLQYFQQAPILRPKRYIQCEPVEKYLGATKILKVKRLPKGWRKQYTRHKKKLWPDVCHVLRFFKNSSLGWSQKSLRDRAKAARADLEYLTLYWLFCGHKHTLPMAAAGFVFENDDGIDVILGPNISGVYLAEINATSLFVKMLLTFDSVFSLRMNAEIDTVFRSFQRAHEQVARDYPDLCSERE
jgi:hypothetical protein